MIKITYKDKEMKTKEFTKISEILKTEIESSKFRVVGAVVNNNYEDLEYELTEDSKIELLDISSKEGSRIYIETLIYIMGKAFQELYPEALITVHYKLSNEMYCELENMEVTKEMIEAVSSRMREIINSDLEIKKVKMSRPEAEEFFSKTGTIRGKLQLDLKENNEISLYFCEQYYNYSYEILANRTSYTPLYNLMSYEKGFLIKYPSTKNPLKIPKHTKTKKLLWALSEYEEIYTNLGVNTVYKLNKAVLENKIKNVIMLSEALHGKNISKIADKIAKNKNIKMILIAGPSASGKTTFAQQLSIQLRLNGLKTVTLSVDNYFVERENTPLDENGNYDFECLEAIDLKLFNEQLERLVGGKEVELPEFNFKTGKKEYKGQKLKLAKDEILVIEGIHCLNDKLTLNIPSNQKFKIYVSALTVLNMDYYNRISTTDTRLIRRILRDYKFRGYSAKETVSRWKIVNEGEEKNIFPYQEEANVLFNTSLIYELGALKPYVMPLLKKIHRTDEEYAETQRLINILKYFEPIPEKNIPANSLLKEFIGGGDFEY